MDTKTYKDIVKRCIKKKIVTSMTSLEMPHMRVKSSETKTKTKTKTEESLSPKEIKEIFNSIINS